MFSFSLSVVDIIQRFVYGFRRCFFVLWFPSSPETFCYGFRRGRKTLFYGFRRRIFGGFCRRRRIQNFRMYRAIPRFLFVFLRLVSVAGCFMVSVVAGKHLFMVSVVGFLMVSVLARNFFMVPVVGCFMVSGCYRTAAASPMESVTKTIRMFP